MTPEQIEKYQVWRNQLIDNAVREFGYSFDVIEPLASGHEYQVYFENGDTPYQALTKSITIRNPPEK
jgi:hypothetical protein